MYTANKKGSTKNPYNKREEKDLKRAFKTGEHAVAPVAKDTNKTRRPKGEARIEMNKEKKVKPVANMKKTMAKKISTKSRDC